MFDGSKAIFERVKRPATVVAIPVTTEGKIIIIKERQPDTEALMTLVSGKVDPGEQPEDALKREMLEEIGYAPETLSLWKEIQPVTKIDWSIYTYIAKGCKKVAEPNPEPGEKIEIELVDFETFLEVASREYFNGSDITSEALRMQLDPQKKAELKKLLFD